MKPLVRLGFKDIPMDSDRELWLCREPGWQLTKNNTCTDVVCWMVEETRDGVVVFAWLPSE